MKPNEKATICCKDCGLNADLENERTMNHNTPTRNKIQFNLTAFVCDECALPLRLYGANFIENYSYGHANTLRCLCDLHAAELMGVSE
jgi:hypothetical protein